MTNSSFSRVAICIVLLLAASAGAGIASAAEPTAAQKSAIRAACQTDYRTYCASVPPGGTAALGCLQKNLASLSSSCQSAVQAISGGAAAAAPAAPAEQDTSQPPAKKTNEPAAKATAQPAVQLTPLQEIRFIRRSCGSDFRSLCGGVPLGGGNAIACLRENAGDLSATCKSALATLAQ